LDFYQGNWASQEIGWPGIGQKKLTLTLTPRKVGVFGKKLPFGKNLNQG